MTTVLCGQSLQSELQSLDRQSLKKLDAKTIALVESNNVSTSQTTIRSIIKVPRMRQYSVTSLKSFTPKN